MHKGTLQKRFKGFCNYVGDRPFTRDHWRQYFTTDEWRRIKRRKSIFKTKLHIINDRDGQTCKKIEKKYIYWIRPVDQKYVHSGEISFLLKKYGGRCFF